jgi:hypothetical protein
MCVTIYHIMLCVVMLNVIMPSVIMLSVIMLNVITLSVIMCWIATRDTISASRFSHLGLIFPCTQEKIGIERYFSRLLFAKILKMAFWSEQFWHCKVCHFKNSVLYIKHFSREQWWVKKSDTISASRFWIKGSISPFDFQWNGMRQDVKVEIWLDSSMERNQL